MRGGIVAKRAGGWLGYGRNAGGRILCRLHGRRFRIARRKAYRDSYPGQQQSSMHHRLPPEPVTANATGTAGSSLTTLETLTGPGPDTSPLFFPGQQPGNASTAAKNRIPKESHFISRVP